MKSYHKKVCTCAIIVTFILFYTFSFAQTESIKGVQFKDGSIIYGRVVKMNVYNIDIQTTDGKIISRKFDDVANFLKDTGVDSKQEIKQIPVAGKVSQDKQVDKILPATSSESADVTGVKQKSSTKVGIGLRVGHNFYKDGTLDFSGSGATGNVDYSNKSAWMYGINGTLTLNENFSIELAIDHTVKSQSDFKVSTSWWNVGDIQQTPLTLTARFHWPIGIFSPYIGAGLGYYWNSFDKNNAFWDPAASVDMDNSVGYHVNAGSEFYLDAIRTLALNIDFKYIWNKADMTASNAGAGVRLNGSMNLDSFVAGLGIKYYF